MHKKVFILSVYPAVNKKTTERIFMNLIPKIFKETSRTILNFKTLAVSLRTTRFNIQKFYMVLTLRCVFCTVLRTNRDFCFIQLLVFITVVERVYCAVRT